MPNPLAALLTSRAAARHDMKQQISTYKRNAILVVCALAATYITVFFRAIAVYDHSPSEGTQGTRLQDSLPDQRDFFHELSAEQRDPQPIRAVGENSLSPVLPRQETPADSSVPRRIDAVSQGIGQHKQMPGEWHASLHTELVGKLSSAWPLRQDGAAGQFSGSTDAVGMARTERDTRVELDRRWQSGEEVHMQAGSGSDGLDQHQFDKQLSNVHNTIVGPLAPSHDELTRVAQSIASAVNSQDALRQLQVDKSFQVKKGWRTACPGWKQPPARGAETDLSFLYSPSQAKTAHPPSCTLCGNQFVLNPPETATGCDIVVATANFGAQDELRGPAGAALNAGLDVAVCYYAFVDAVTRDAFAISPGSTWHGWRTVEVSGFPFADPRMNGKIPKLLLFKYFKHVKYFVWVDSKFQLRMHPATAVYQYLLQKRALMAMSENFVRDCTYQEAEKVVKAGLAQSKLVDPLIKRFRKVGFPAHFGLPEAGFFVYANHETVRHFMCTWFDMIVATGVSRDQLSFPYLRWKHGLKQQILLFQKCEFIHAIYEHGHVRRTGHTNANPTQCNIAR